MANKIYFDPTSDTAVVWADFAGDFGDAVAGTEKQITLASLGIGDSREGVKADMFVNSHLPQRWAVLCRFEMDVAVADGESIQVFWAASPHATAATLNPYLITGADAEIATPTAGFLGQLQWIGAVPLTVAIAPNVHQKCFITTIPLRYGSPLVFNDTSQAFEGDDVEMFVAFYPLVDEAQ